MFWTGQEIPKDEKHEILSLYTSGTTVILCGTLASLTIFFLLVLPFTLFLRNFLKGEPLPLLQLILYFISFAIFGGIAGWLLRKEYRLLRQEFEESKVSWVWILSFLFLFIILPELPITDSDKPRAILYRIGGSVILAIWLKTLWNTFDRFWLSVISRVDWRLTIDEERICQQLRLKFAEVKRYPAPLSLIAVGIDEWDNIVNRLRQKGIRKLEKEIVNILSKNVRQSDIFGRVNNGRIIIVLSNTAGVGARVSAERIQKVLQSKVTTGLTVSAGIVSYNNSIASPEEMMNKAVETLQHAATMGKSQIVFHGKEMSQEHAEGRFEGE